MPYIDKSYSDKIHHFQIILPPAKNPIREKQYRRPPHRTTESQKQILLSEFDKNPTPGMQKRAQLARQLNVDRRIIKNWFSNHRATMRRTQARHRDHHPFRSVSTSSYGSEEDERDAHTGTNLVAPRTPEPLTIPQHINTTPYSCASPTSAHIPQTPLIMPHDTRTCSLSTPPKLSTLFHPLSSLVSSYRWTSTVEPLSYSQPYHTMSCSDTCSTLVIGFPESALRTSLQIE